jgi:cholesterol oxidase
MHVDMYADAREPVRAPASAGIVIIGSGCGGGVTAMRLTEAGLPVTVIERGRRWDIIPHRDRPFCTNMKPDGRAAWLSDTTIVPIGPRLPIDRYIGVFERVHNPNLDVFCGSAWGGASVVTGMLSLVPYQHLFEQVFPPEISYAEMVRVYYPRATAVLNASPIPRDILGSETYTSMRVMIRQVQRASLGVKMIPTATDWDIMRKELSGGMFRCGIDGELVYGNNSGWKNSVDRTYLRRAEATGRLSIVLQHRVSDIGLDGDGRYQLTLEAIDDRGDVVRTSTLRCTTLFVCGGSYGTSALFVRARDKGLLPRLSDEVGEGFGNNGNVMFMRELPDVDTGPNQGGPPSIGIAYPDNPLGANFVEHAQFAAGELSRGNLLHFSMCMNPTRGRFVYDGDTDTVTLQWPANGNEFSRHVASETLDRLNDSNGGQLANNLFIAGMIDGFTFHPLGAWSWAARPTTSAASKATSGSIRSTPR